MKRGLSVKVFGELVQIYGRDIHDIEDIPGMIEVTGEEVWVGRFLS